MGKPLVIVESPAKARTIAKLLGAAFRVEASVGHIRDLPRNASEVPAARKKDAWARLGVDVANDFEPLYVVPAEKRAQVKLLKDALADASALYLATDEDREGESISWHLVEVLKPRVPVRRLVFHEITPTAIHNALAHPRAVDLDLVRAQETRRIVDRLFGYEVSPLLWRKVRRDLSAGRVQSVAVRLVVERERQRLRFVSAAWWDVVGLFEGEAGRVEAALATWEGARVATGKDIGDDGRLKRNANAVVLDEAAARGVVAALQGAHARVARVDEKPYADRPAPPFTTSTLQQEANRKLKWTARRTMQVAQRLYETGWITYMRTDSTTLSGEAVSAARRLIAQQYGAPYLPAKARVYKSTAKNAQEAHEAIRPAGESFRSLDQADQELDPEAARLYGLIWKRTVASQMADATGKHVVVAIEAGRAEFAARGKTIEFPGFRRAYVEDSDTPEADISDQERVLPPLRAGDRLAVRGLEARAHATQPPARLTEATLVKELEARGIGRPSTYATIIDTILRREYVFKKGTALVPTFTAFAVTALLEQHLTWLVDYDFTAQMEARLDDVAVGSADATDYLRRFYLGESGLRDRLAEAAEKIDPRVVCTIPVAHAEDGTAIDVRVGRYGPFLAQGDLRADLPDDLPPDELTPARARALIDGRKQGPAALGDHPESGLPVYLMNGRFGPYVQLGEAEGKERPPRASLLPGMKPADVDLDVAVRLLTLPRTLGSDPGTGEAVVAANGRYGPYVKRGETSRSVPEGVSVLDIGLADALALLAKPASRRRAPQAVGELGLDASTGRSVKLMSGRFGPYVTDGETNATLPKGVAPETVDLEAAIGLIRKREEDPKRPRRKAAPKAARPPAAKKAKASGKKTAAAPKAARTTRRRKSEDAPGQPGLDQ